MKIVCTREKYHREKKKETLSQEKLGISGEIIGIFFCGRQRKRGENEESTRRKALSMIIIAHTPLGLRLIDYIDQNRSSGLRGDQNESESEWVDKISFEARRRSSEEDSEEQLTRER